MKKNLQAALVVGTAATLLLTACSGGSTGSAPTATNTAANASKSITLWLAGGDTPRRIAHLPGRHVQGPRPVPR
jgi:N,N'-diacetylchitobiose transport system substrate-binding protein